METQDLVQLDTEFCENLVRADLLSQVGQEMKVKFYCPRVKTLADAEKTISGAALEKSLHR